MSNGSPDSTISTAPAPVCTTIAVACPLVLLAAYAFLASPHGTRMYDGFASRNIGAGIAAMGILFLFVAGLLILGLVMSACAIRRSEQPAWLSRVSLVGHSITMLAALGKIFL